MKVPAMNRPRPARMQHIAIEVSDTDRSIEWYRRVLGFKITERHAAFEVEGIPVELTFMRLANVHHEIVLVHNPKKTYRMKPRPEADFDGPPNFHHAAFECDNRDDWLALLDRIRAEGAEVVRGPVLHSFVQPRGDGSWGENEAVYILDPDGHRIELFCDLATIDSDGTHVNATGVRLNGTGTEEL